MGSYNTQAYKLRIWMLNNQNMASLAWKKKAGKKEKNCHNTSNRVSLDFRHFSEAKALFTLDDPTWSILELEKDRRRRCFRIDELRDHPLTSLFTWKKKKKVSKYNLCYIFFSCMKKKL